LSRFVCEIAALFVISRARGHFFLKICVQDILYTELYEMSYILYKVCGIK